MAIRLTQKLTMFLALAMLGCSGGGGGSATASYQPPPPMEITLQGIELQASAPPGSTLQGMLHLHYTPAGTHLIALASQSSLPGVTVSLAPAVPATSSNGLADVPFKVVVESGASIGVAGDLSFSAWDQTAGGKPVSGSRPFTVTDFPLSIQFTSFTLPATAGPGDQVQGTAEILAQGPAGTVIDLSTETSDAQIQGILLTATSLSVHEPKTYQVQVSFRISQEAIPNASLGIAIFASAPDLTRYSIAWLNVTDFPTFLAGSIQSPDIPYYPGSPAAQPFRIQSSGGFGGPLALSIEGLPSEVGVTWDDPAPILTSGGSVADQFHLAFPSTFTPRFMNTALVVSSGGQTRHYPFHLANTGDPDFAIRTTSSELRLAPGTIQRFKVEVRSIRGFQGDVTLACQGMDDKVTYAFSPSTLSLGQGASETVDLYLGAAPDALSYSFYVVGTSGTLVRQAIANMALTTQPALEINTDASWVPVVVGNTATWKVRLRSINGYAGPASLTGQIGLAGASLIQFTPAAATINPGQELEIQCSSFIQDGEMPNAIRIPAEATAFAPSGQFAKVYIWPQKNPEMAAGIPDTIPKLPRTGTLTVDVPIRSLNGLSQSLDITPFAWAYGATGVRESCALDPTTIGPGLDGKVSATLTDQGLQSSGTYTFQVGAYTQSGQTPLRYGTWDIPFVLVDPLQPDWYAVAMATDIRPSAQGPVSIPVKVGSVSGFVGTVHLGLEGAACAWSIDVPDVTLAAGEERVVTLTLQVPQAGSFDFEPFVTSTAGGPPRRQKLHVAFD